MSDRGDCYGCDEDSAIRTDRVGVAVAEKRMDMDFVTISPDVYDTRYDAPPPQITPSRRYHHERF